MVMDIRRSCRKEWVQFFKLPPRETPTSIGSVGGGSGGIAFTQPDPPLTQIRWYFAPEGAIPIREGQIWASALYLDYWELCDTPSGVDPFAPSAWTNGKTPVGITGTSYCGKLSDFQEPGEYDPARTPLPRGANGIPCCCNPALCAAIVFVGSPPGAGNCPCCHDVESPLTFHVRLNATGYPFDGEVWQVDGLSGPSGCQWFGSTLTAGVRSDFFGRSAVLDGSIFKMSWQSYDDPGARFWCVGPTPVFDPPQLFSCDPWSFEMTGEIFLDGVPTGDTVTVSIYSIP